MKKQVVRYFSPPSIKYYSIDDALEELNVATGKSWTYVYKGRVALYWIVRGYLKRPGNSLVMLPNYSCDSVLYPFKFFRNIRVTFYDCDEDDLNPDNESIITKLSVMSRDRNYEDFILVYPSLYGNPANLSEVEKLSVPGKRMILIDDAAQSFGSKIDDKYVGTFGNAGFFSLSPGKSTVAHSGAFLWSDSELKLSYRRTLLSKLHHRVNFYDFYFNRVCDIGYYCKIMGEFFKILDILLYKFRDFRFDSIEKFEETLLGGVIHSILNDGYTFRREFYDEFVQEFRNSPCFRIVSAKRGEAHPVKIVLVFYKESVAEKFKKFLNESGISYRGGYRPLKYDPKELPVSSAIFRRVVELPINEELPEMNYMMRMVKKFHEDQC